MNTHDTPRPAGDDETTVVVTEAKPGGEVIVAVEVDGDIDEIVVEIVDIEEHGRANRRPPPAKRYRVRIDKPYFEFNQRFVTGRQLLEKAGKVPAERFEIEKRMHGGRYVPVGLNETVDLGEPGIEVFETFPLDETEG